jgi:hypothetical protein
VIHFVLLPQLLPGLPPPCVRLCTALRTLLTRAFRELPALRNFREVWVVDIDERAFQLK